MIDLIKEISQTLQHNKLRTALTGFSVSWGIFVLIVLLGMGNGVVNSFRENALGPGSQKISIYGGETSKPYHGYREGRSIELKNSDISLIEDEHPEFVDGIATKLYGPTSTISSGKYSITNEYIGVSPLQIKNTSDILKIHGRSINNKDMLTKAKAMLISMEYANQLFPPDGTKAVGQRVSMGGLSYQIIGVYESRWGRSIYIPYTTAQMLAGNDDKPGNIEVMLKNLSTKEEGDDAETKLRNTMAAAHDFNPDDHSAVWIWNQFSNGLRGMKAMDILTLSIWILGLLTLLSGIVSISNIMFVSVKERTHEIGIRRAIGAKPRSIVVQIITESIAITTLFGYIGIFLGTILTQCLGMIFSDSNFIKNPTVSITMAIEVTIVLILSGAFAGLFPALKALKVKPVEALRDE